MQLAADLQEALKDWQEIASLARSFETAVPALRRYLDSDAWTYEQPAIDPNRIYQISSRLTGQAGVLDYDPQTLSTFWLALGPADGNFKTHYWSFRRMGNGWYQIQNMWGDALTYGEKPYLSPASGTQAQCWRFVAAGDGWYRLVNLTAPHQHVLGVFKANTTHQIISHHGKKFLFIPISESISTVKWADHRLEATTMSASDGDLTQQWQVANGITHNTSFAEQGDLISRCISGDSRWAMTLDGTSVVATPLRNTIWQKWTAVYEQVMVNGILLEGVAYVCQGMGVVLGSANAPLIAEKYVPGQLRFLWMTRTMQFNDGVYMNIIHPLVGTGQVWDIFGGCPSAFSSRIGLHGENGGHNQHWSALMI